MKQRDRRLKILSEQELIDIYEIRPFTPAERFDYFSLSVEEEHVFEYFRGLNSRILFVFAFGYFKARKRFFTVDPSLVSADIEFIVKHVFHSHQKITGTISKPTKVKHQNLILELTGYKFCHSEERSALQDKACSLAALHADPVYLFKELMFDLEKKRVILPGYTVMQDIVAQAIHCEEVRYEQTLKNKLTDSDVKSLQKLLVLEDQLHDLTFLKHDPKNFSYKEMSQEIRRKRIIDPLYVIARRVLPHVRISRKNRKYFTFLRRWAKIARFSAFLL